MKKNYKVHFYEELLENKQEYFIVRISVILALLIGIINIKLKMKKD